VADGWLLDITEEPDGRSLALWVKDRGGAVAPQVVPYRPPFWVDGPREALDELARALEGDPRVERTEIGRVRPTLESRRPRPLLAVWPQRNPERRALATSVDERGGYVRFTLYDVDLAPAQLYHLEHGVYPFAPVTGAGPTLAATEPAEVLEYTPPPLTRAELSIELSHSRRDGIIRADDTIRALQLGPVHLEGPEEELLGELLRELERQDPDLLLTDGGDGFDLPWLYRRAAALGWDARAFSLGRRPGPWRPHRAASSYMTYGRIQHKDATYPLLGRFHIDRANSMLYDDAAVEGLLDAARLSRLSLQTVARQSPGTCFTAMEMAHARAEGVHVPWKKNRPEEFKSARTLLSADRGGVILLPPVGVHDAVEEFDFASLYPHIMVRQNLSIETLNCRCCPRARRIAPGLGYRSCDRRVGLIPRTLAPLLARRLAYKAIARDRTVDPATRARFAQRVKMLKWILVTAFGYQGYRNARFGRIECHEAINAYARDLLARLFPAAEEAGYRVLHGIVDSLWLSPVDRAAPPDPVEFARTVSERFDLPLGYEGRYRWVVFLPAVTHGFGVPNRYYGRYAHGEFKLRGIGSRRHDTPVLLRRFEGEILDLFARAPDAPGVLRLLPRALARARRFAERVAEGAWPVEELLIAHRLSQPLGEYAVFTEAVAALRQLAANGVERAPGETVRYVIVDRKARAWRDRVRVAELLERDTPYDPAAYLELLARSAETLLAPLGVERAALLASWPQPPPVPAPRYRSPEALGQGRLDASSIGGSVVAPPEGPGPIFT
jgi:DNA polymerase elongation subunit (family B)